MIESSPPYLERRFHQTCGSPSAGITTALVGGPSGPPFAEVAKFFDTVVCPLSEWDRPFDQGLARHLADNLHPVRSALAQLPETPAHHSVRAMTLAGRPRCLLAVRTPNSRATQPVTALDSLYEELFSTAKGASCTDLLLPLLGVSMGSLSSVACVAARMATEFARGYRVNLTFASSNAHVLATLNLALHQVCAPPPALTAEGPLDSGSPLPQLIQYPLHRYYALPYPGKPELRPRGINRPFHGVTHAARTCLGAEMFIQLYGHFFQNPPLRFDEERLLVLGAAYHDAGNHQEVDPHTRDHGILFRTDMHKLGFAAVDIEEVAQAIDSKDSGPAWSGVSDEKRGFYRSIIHDADCLEIMRVRGRAGGHRAFDPAYLHLWCLGEKGTETGELVARRQGLEKIARVHGETIRNVGDYLGASYERHHAGPIDGSRARPLHLSIENADNAYAMVRSVMTKLARERLGKEEVSILEMYGWDS